MCGQSRVRTRGREWFTRTHRVTSTTSQTRTAPRRHSGTWTSCTAASTMTTTTTQAAVAAPCVDATDAATIRQTLSSSSSDQARASGHNRMSQRAAAHRGIYQAYWRCGLHSGRPRSRFTASPLDRLSSHRIALLYYNSRADIYLQRYPDENGPSVVGISHFPRVVYSSSFFC